MAATADALSGAAPPALPEPPPRPPGDLDRLIRVAARALRAPAAMVTTLRPRGGERVLLGHGMREPLAP
ncbi:MAG TPA: hypothetical protein VFZ20_11545, partial [Longimicrobium sp.]